MIVLSAFKRRRMNGPVNRFKRAEASASRWNWIRARDAVMDHHGQIGREALGLLPPIVGHRGRTDEQRGPFAVRMPFALDERQSLNRFTESHVVRQTRAQSPSLRKSESRITANLIGTELAVKLFRNRQFFEGGAAFELSEEIAYPAVRRHAVEGQSAGRLRATQGHLHYIDRLSRAERTRGHRPRRDHGLAVR